MSRAEPSQMSPTILHLPRKYEPNQLYISRVNMSQIIFTSPELLLYFGPLYSYITLDPPLWSGPRSKQKDISRVTKSIPSLHISSIQPRDLNPKMGGCVSPRGREPGGRLGHWPSPYITLARGQVAPPAPSPVVAHTLPSLD